MNESIIKTEKKTFIYEWRKDKNKNFIYELKNNTKNKFTNLRHRTADISKNGVI